MTTDQLRERLAELGLHGVLLHFDEVAEADWLAWLVDVESTERQRRSLERRIRNAKLGRFKPMADFDWAWPSQIDRAQIAALLRLDFIAEGANPILFGPNGVGKTMIAKNIAHAALLAGHTVRFTTASTMLNELAAQDSAAALRRHLRRYTSPRLLCVDEVGYLSYGNRHADLLFEVVTRRYTDGAKPTLVTTNKAFSDWSEVFPNATCVVTLIDRLVHRSEVVNIQGESYRLREARERAANRSKSRAKKSSAKD